MGKALTTLLLITIYVAIWASSPIWVKLSYQNQDKYNKQGPLLLVEALKLTCSMIIVFQKKNGVQKCMNFNQGKLLLLPAILYLVVNSANWVALQYLTPATCSLLMNLKLLTTGILTQIIFKEKLGSRKWLGLIVITTGAIVAQINDQFNMNSLFGVVLMLIHCVCSSLASVYFTWLLKHSTLSFGLWEQNAWLYFFGIFTNILFILCTDWQVLAGRDIPLYNKYCLLSILVYVTGGISTSYILKYLDAIYKEICSVLLVFVQILLQRILFNESPNKFLIYGFIIVAIGIVIYNYDLFFASCLKYKNQFEQIDVINEKENDSLIKSHKEEA